MHFCIFILVEMNKHPAIHLGSDSAVKQSHKISTNTAQNYDMFQSQYPLTNEGCSVEIAKKDIKHVDVFSNKRVILLVTIREEGDNGLYITLVPKVL